MKLKQHAPQRRELCEPLRDFIHVFERESGRQGCAVILTAGAFADEREANQLLTACAEQTRKGMLPPLKVLVIGFGADVDVAQLDRLKRHETFHRFDFRVVPRAERSPKLASSIADQLWAYSPLACVRRPDGTVLAEYHDRLPHVLRFANVGDDSFSFEVAGRSYVCSLRSE